MFQDVLYHLQRAEYLIYIFDVMRFQERKDFEKLVNNQEDLDDFLPVLVHKTYLLVYLKN